MLIVEKEVNTSNYTPMTIVEKEFAPLRHSFTVRSRAADRFVCSRVYLLVESGIEPVQESMYCCCEWS